jgi:HD-GYP domain-containing protein (c-di-GMP phosphodiesterase class II)
MNSDLPSDAPTRAASRDDGGSELSLVALLRMRGAPLVDALDAHFHGSREVGEAAAAYAFAAAVELGLMRSSAELIREAAKLHDIGRVYVPAEILAKPAWSRTPEEGAQVEAHHEWGAQLARGAGIPDRVCEWIRLGAERWDGGGPNRLAGEAIPLQARISRAAYACYAALTEATREGGVADPHRRPIDALHGSAGRELDPMVVDALEAILARAKSQ